MSALRFLNISIDHPSGRDSALDPKAASKIKLRLTTESGRIRDVPLDRLQLLGLIAESARALLLLEKS